MIRLNRKLYNEGLRILKEQPLTKSEKYALAGVKLVTKKKTKKVALKAGEKGGTRIGVRQRVKVELFDRLGWCAWGEASNEGAARRIAESNWPTNGKTVAYEQVTCYTVNPDFMNN